MRTTKNTRSTKMKFLLAICISAAFCASAMATPADDYAVGVAAVTKSLKCPSTAKFPKMDGADAGAEVVNGKVARAWGYVDAQNVYGAMIRSEWEVIWNTTTKKICYFKLGDDEMGFRAYAIANGI